MRKHNNKATTFQQFFVSQFCQSITNKYHWKQLILRWDTIQNSIYYEIQSPDLVIDVYVHGHDFYFLAHNE